MLTVLAPFPPPFGGAGKNSEILVRALEATMPVTRLRSAPPTLSHERSSRHLWGKLGALARAALGVAIARRRSRVLYIVPDGGPGLLASCLIVLLALTLAYRLHLHHRTYRYVARRSLALAAVLWVGRQRIEHVFLDETMRRAFASRYPCRGHSSVISNALFLPEPPVREPRAPDGILIIGHVSNLSIDKGLDVVLESFRAVRRSGVAARLALAGPIADGGARRLLERASQEFGNVLDYRGALYGRAKLAFYSRIDLLLFPTRFALEAEPNVVLEAMNAGCVTVGSAVGVIPALLADERGRLVDSLDLFPASVVALALELAGDPARRKVYGERARAFVRQRAVEAAAAFEALADRLLEQAVHPAGRAPGGPRLLDQLSRAVAEVG